MARPSSADVLDKFRWKVQITQGSSNLITRSGFMTTDAPSLTYNTKEYPEGGSHLSPRIIIDSATYKPITLSRGVTYNQDFYNWAILPLYATGTLNPNLYPAPVNFINTDYRRSVTISHLDRTSNIVKVYLLYNAIPVEFQGSSDFNAESDDGVSIEKLVIRYESFQIVSADSNQNNPFSLQDITQKLIQKYLT